MKGRRRMWGYCNEVTAGSAEGLWGAKGIGYRGKQTKTRSGRTCQAWDQQTPHKHSNGVDKKPGFGQEANFCRNPGGGNTIWCYTTDASKRWEYCDPIHENNKDAGNQEDLTGINKNLGYRGSQTKTNKGVMCLMWTDPMNTKYTPAKYGNADLRENFCRNPGKSGRTVWCYTGMKGSRRMWGYCNEVEKGNPEGLWKPKGIGYRG